MIQNTLNELQRRIETSETINGDKKDGILKLVSDLKEQIDALPEDHRERAETISSFARVSLQEALKKEKNPDLLNLATEGLAESVKDFEASHPRLVQTVNSICVMLANIGI